ncbi:MAG: transcription-repair coupling factor [Spirochaetia bacterium]|nr:transcription-repair coupling factor [Spirochaetia bacterium]
MKDENSINLFLQSFLKHPEINKIYQSQEKVLTGMSFSSLASVLYAYSKKLTFNKNYLIILPRQRQAKELFETLRFIEDKINISDKKSKSELVLYFPDWGMLPFLHAKPDSENEGVRTKALSRLIQKEKPVILVTSIDVLARKIPAKEYFHESEFLLKKNQRININDLLNYLQTNGYERVDMAEKTGHFSVKGGIVDIFCPAYFNPVRVDFFGDEIDSIRFFDPLSQKSYETISAISIFARRDLIYSNEDIEKTSEEIQKKSRDKIHPPFTHTREPLDLSGLWDFYPLFCETSSLIQFFNEEPEIILWDMPAAFERLSNFLEELKFLRDKNNEKYHLNINELFFSESEIKELIKNATIFSSVPQSLHDFSLHLQNPPVFKGKISSMVETLNQEEYAAKQIFISSRFEGQKERLEHVLSGYKDKKFSCTFLISPFQEGFLWSDGLLLTDKEIFGKSVRAFRASKSATQIIESFVDLKEGDYVVHVNYGIGRFVRLKRMTAAGNERDFLELEYASNDKLYVPLEHLNQIHRYIGSTENPSLDYLGKKSSWEKTKTRVQESIEKLAVELLEIYAKREKARGIVFPKDSRFQEEFEAGFPYEETDDQISSINEVKKDMESEKPMDRLICGDVGFGKTEVAIRAAFKAVIAGKQAAVLCPTTILAFQHYNTFKDRFLGYPVEIDFLSRFKTAGQVKDIKEKLKTGKLDIVIGTHALLSKTISFKNLGLLVIDEEQRFGVKHKENIKKIKSNIDCITLTATPIPRTLQMSLMGIRDLSLIETPPRNRQKIETYVLEENEEILKHAVFEELKRNGQVFVLHNKVKTIDAQVHRLKNLFPKVKAAALHGQMPEDQIENVMLDFYKGYYDILVSTTIIESGIDIPNVNTLIVLNSQNFGLSQMYQLKGRIGRSDRQAYAYFFYPAKSSISETAQKRLNTIQEYDELGAGFKIAMKDLEIRGAGNILGKEQSGDIMEVGFELYLSMLQDKIAEMKHEEKEHFQSMVSIPQDFFFPDSYISDTAQKMEFYKKFFSSQTIEELEKVQEEMTDRFGISPENVQAMLSQAAVQILSSQLRLDKIEWNKEKFILTASPVTAVSMDKLIKLMKNDTRFKAHPADPRKIEFIPSQKETGKALLECRRILEYLV